MDPYLEHPDRWPDVHNRLIAALDEHVSPRLPPRYFMALEQRVYIAEPSERELVGRPDAVVIGIGPPGGQQTSVVIGSGTLPSAAGAAGGVQVLAVEVPVPDRIRETYLEVREAATGEVVTLIEVLSPTNKRPGEGRREYEAKRLQTLGTMTHLVEIDLLRSGEPLPARLLGESLDVRPPGHYRVLVARGDRRPRADLHVFTIHDALLVFPLPLQSGDDEPMVELPAVFQTVYDRGRYRLRLDYSQDPVPPLAANDAAWSDRLLRAHGLR